MWPELTGFSGLAVSVVVVLWLCGLAIIGRFSLRFSQSSLVSVQSILLPFLLPPAHFTGCPVIVIMWETFCQCFGWLDCVDVGFQDVTYNNIIGPRSLVSVVWSLSVCVCGCYALKTLLRRVLYVCHRSWLLNTCLYSLWDKWLIVIDQFNTQQNLLYSFFLSYAAIWLARLLQPWYKIVLACISNENQLECMIKCIPIKVLQLSCWPMAMTRSLSFYWPTYTPYYHSYPSDTCSYSSNLPIKGLVARLWPTSIYSDINIAIGSSKLIIIINHLEFLVICIC